MLKSLFVLSVVEKNERRCLVGTSYCYSCSKSSLKKMYFLMLKAQGKENSQTQAIGMNFDAPKKNHLYALQSRGNQESSPDVDTVMLQVFSINVYALLDRGGTFSFVTPLMAMKFYMLPDVLDEPFSIYTR